MSKLAIIMPIYKPDFLQEALKSLAAQTCQDFTLYIGDDCSPHPLSDIVMPFTEKMDLRYTRFEHNLGATDLIGQWERCICLAKDEEWLWMFSDDDCMDSNCVESFYKMLQLHPQHDLFHFDVTVIESDGRPTADRHFVKEDFPKWLSAKDFLKRRLKYRINSYVVEYIFRRKTLNAIGGFVRFPLAWCSDDATWYKMGQRSGILTIPDVRVYWRKSDANITPNKSSAVQRQKLKAVTQFLKFCWQELGFASLPTIFNYFLHALYQARSIIRL
jgi:glycosyltransferase involved in cell wall biosynthesis